MSAESSTHFIKTWGEHLVTKTEITQQEKYEREKKIHKMSA